MSECIFCEIVSRNRAASVLCRDEISAAFMDIRPVNAGHVLIIPNRHFSCLDDPDEATGAHLFTRSLRIAAAIRKSGVTCQGINMFPADGEAAGDIPCPSARVSPLSGDTFGFLWGSSITHIPGREELEEIAGTIRGTR
jgi:histidine triad (HIT) family protein